MSQVLHTLVAVAALMASLFGALMALGFLLAGAANSSPTAIRNLKIAMLSIALVTLTCSVVSVVLMTRHHPWSATLVAGAPAVMLVVGFIILFAVSGS